MGGRRSLRLAALATAVAALVALVAACGGDDDSNKTATQAPSGGSPAASSTAGAQQLPLASEKILFGAPISLTGATAKEGEQTRNGYQLWAGTVNKNGGIPVGDKRYLVELKILDDQSSGETSAQLAEKLIKEDKINFLLGPYGTTPTFSVTRVAEQNGVPMVQANGAAERIFNQGYKYTFGVLSPASNYLKGVLEFAAAQNPKPKTVALMYADDAFSVEVAEAAKKRAEESGFQVTYFEKYKDKETNLQAQLTAVKSKAPDILLNAGHLQEAVAIMKQAKDLGVLPQLFAFSVGPALPDFTQSLGNDANFVVTGSQWSTAVKYTGDDYWKTAQAYADDYKAKFGEEPAYQAAESTAAGIAYEKALKAAGTLNRDKVRDALAKLDIITFYGPIKFDARGANVTKAMVVEQIQGGKRVTIWPADVANAKGLWPTPEWGKR
jgi:branched-chain amino acid transport system substrate-binding protein